MKNINVRRIAAIGLLIAMEIVLSRFLSISTPIVKIGFSFLPTALAAIMFGPVCGGVVAGISDIIGATLFPIGAYFPGFTVSAAITGAVFGLFLHKRKGSWAQLACAVTVNCLGVSLLLSTFWLTVITGSPFLALLPPRVIQNLAMAPIQFAVLRMIQKPVAMLMKNFRPDAPQSGMAG
jgi:ECF transporter S component (folate family)